MPFEKDFGYLLPFLDRVAAAAADLEDEGARAELTALMRDEKQRWARIQALLSGAAGGERRSTPPSPSSPREPNQRSEIGGLTVGSLRP